MNTNHARDLRKVLEENKFLTLPGVYDCLSARIAEEAGFPALFLSGGALAYSALGRPDLGFLGLAEFGNAIQHIVSSCRVPLLADADNGFGNAIQAANTGAMYEQLGAAGLQIDDKVLPSTHPAKNEIVGWEMVGPKIEAVRDNVSEDFVIVYRTCANLYGYGIDESIRRINLAKERGADYAYVDGIKSVGEIREMNFSIGLFPISSMLAASQGMIEVMEALASQGTTLGVSEKMTNPPTRIHSMMGQFSLVEKYSPYYDR